MKRAIRSFGGYADAQLRRLQNAIARDTLPQSEREQHILKSVKNALDDFNRRYAGRETGSIRNYIDRSDNPAPDSGGLYDGVLCARKHLSNRERVCMDIRNYQAYISAETMMGPNSVRILAELFDRYPLRLAPEDLVLDLGCGTGLTSLVIAKETGARVYANDLWISAEENGKRFARWGVGDQITPVCEDANDLHFEKKQFRALVSIDAYHYFAGSSGFFEEKLLPLLKDGGAVLVGIPGLKEEYAGRARELLSDWLGEDAYMFKSPGDWSALIGGSNRIDSVETWEMDCFREAWDDWLESDHKFALGDRKFYETVIQPYTCFVGISVTLKEIYGR